MKKFLILSLIGALLIVLVPASKSFAFGNDLGEHCWTGDSGVVIRHQVTQLGSQYNLNGTITLASGPNAGKHPAYGTGFLDTTSGQIKLAYTIAFSIAYEKTHALLLLDPATLNGTKILVDNGFIEAVNYTPCP